MSDDNVSIKKIPTKEQAGSFFAEKLLQIMHLHDTEFMRIVRQAVGVSVPLLLIAAVLLLLTMLPLPAYQSFLTDTFGPAWRGGLQMLIDSIMAIVCLTIPLSLSASLIGIHNNRYIWAGVPLPMGIITIFVANMVMLGPQPAGPALSVSMMGLPGLFGALLTSIVGTMFFLRLCRMPGLRFHLYADNSEPVLGHIFSCFLPSVITVGLFAALRGLLVFFGFESLNTILLVILEQPFLHIESSIFFGVAYTIVSHVCWFFGLHGPAVLEPLTQGFFWTEAATSAQLLVFGDQPHVLTKSILDVFVYIGGSGATLGLVLAMLISRPDEDSKRLGWTSLFFGIFNINEIVIFGLPIIFNPIFLIPFVVAPLVLIFTSVSCMYLGIVPQPMFPADWTTPPLFNAYMTTHSVAAVILQVVNLGLATMIYLPFVRLSQQHRLRKRQGTLEHLVGIASAETYHPRLRPCFTSISKDLARFLASQLEQDIYRRSPNIGLVFQPRVNTSKQSVPVVEALLRWHNNACGDISPMLAMALALEGNFSRKLDNYILDLILQQQYRWRTYGVETTVAMNLSHNQLENYEFVDYLHAQLHNYQLPVDAISLEIKERTSLGTENTQHNNIEAVRYTGVNITIDDFGKGFQPIIYLHNLPVSGIQITKELVFDIVENRSKQELLINLNEICEELDIKTSVGWVETAEQYSVLRDLHFNVFQGYYFAKPMSADDCAKFIQEIKAKAKDWA